MICDRHELSRRHRLFLRDIHYALEFGREDDDVLRELAQMNYYGGMAPIARLELARREALS